MNIHDPYTMIWGGDMVAIGLKDEAFNILRLIAPNFDHPSFTVDDDGYAVRLRVDEGGKRVWVYFFNAKWYLDHKTPCTLEDEGECPRCAMYTRATGVESRLEELEELSLAIAKEKKRLTKLLGHKCKGTGNCTICGQMHFNFGDRDTMPDGPGEGRT